MSRSDQEAYANHMDHHAKVQARKRRIRALNDDLRQRFAGGRVMLTTGARSLPEQEFAQLLTQVQAFDSFTEDNDPHGEHDFGSLTVGDNQVFWKIDCYDKQLEHGSPDPSDPEVTARVLTIMLASEY